MLYQSDKEVFKSTTGTYASQTKKCHQAGQSSAYTLHDLATDRDSELEPKQIYAQKTPSA
jgi:hypothetical protein